MKNGALTAAERIDEHRVSIDGLDEKILALLNERAEHSLAIRALKPEVGMDTYDPAREDQIMARLAELSEGPLRESDIRKLYTTLLQVMREVRA